MYRTAEPTNRLITGGTASPAFPSNNLDAIAAAGTSWPCRVTVVPCPAGDVMSDEQGRQPDPPPADAGDAPHDQREPDQRTLDYANPFLRHPTARVRESEVGVMALALVIVLAFLTLLFEVIPMLAGATAPTVGGCYTCPAFGLSLTVLLLAIFGVTEEDRGHTAARWALWSVAAWWVLKMALFAATHF